MDGSKIKKLIIFLVHPLLGWIFCGATIGIGLATTTESNALLIHAIAAPIIFAIISLIYFRKFDYTTPLKTAIAFVSFVIFMDVFVVALLIEKSFEMFESMLGTWIPFSLIFISTYLTGVYTRKFT